MLLIVAMTVVPWVTLAQSLGEYTFSTGIDTTRWINMESATQILTPSNSDGLASSVQNIGFSFPFGNNSYMQYSVNTDGNLRLGSTVTGTGNYSIPFSAANANANNPKINFFGCDGYGVAGIHYVKALNTVDSNEDSLLVVEFCMGTNNSTTRNNLYKWQVHLYPNGNIEAVFGLAPTAGPSAVHQQGLCIDASDGWTVDASHVANHFTGGTSFIVASGSWPTEGRYYRFEAPVYSCPSVHNLTVTHVTDDTISIAWLPRGSETSWLVGDGVTESVVYIPSITFSGLAPHTAYTFSVRAICPATSDTSEAVTVSALTLCSNITVLPFRENFDRYVGSTTNPVSVNNLPICWDYINRGTRANYMGYPILYNGNGYAHSEGNCIRYYTARAYADSNQYAILPPTDSVLLPINSLRMSYYMRASSSSSNSIAQAVVGVITDPTDASTFVPIDTFNTSWVMTYTLHTVDFTSYSGPHGRIAFLFPKPLVTYSGNSGYVDDLVLEAIPDCLPAINMTASNITVNSAQITWSDTTGFTSWNLEYGESGFALGTGILVNVNDTTFFLNGLRSGTAYDVYITNSCPGGVAGTAYLTFSTECGTLDTLPYFEDFESYPIGAPSYVPPECGIPCWYRIDNATSAHIGYVGNPSEWPSGARSGMKFLYYYFPPTGNAYPDWVINSLPPVDTAIYPINTLKLSFWAKMDVPSYSGQVVVGVMTDPTDNTTFVPVDTVGVGGIIYELKEVLLDGYTGTGTYVAIRLSRNPSIIAHYFIDDLLLEPIPTCPAVEFLTNVGNDSNMLTLTWVETGTATSWRIEYGVSGFTPGTGLITTATAIPFNITGLTPATHYDVYVTPICTGGNSLTRMATFLTANRTVEIPFFCDFEDTVQNALWSLENGANPNKWCIGTATNNGGTNSLYVTGDNGVSNSYTVSSADAVDYAFVDVVIPTPGEYGYSYDWKCNGERTNDYMRVALIPASETLVASTTPPRGYYFFAEMPSTWLPLDGGVKLNLHPSWQNRTNVVHVPSAGTYHLAFIFRCDNIGGAMPPPAVDNIMFVHTPCIRPDSITLNNLTQTSVDINWVDTGDAVEWQYQVDSGNINTVYVTHANLTGLTGNTHYVFRARSICGGGDTSFWHEIEFRTPCSYISLPYTQDFESAPIGSNTSSDFIDCWYHHNNGISYYGYPYVSNTTNHTLRGSKGLYWYNAATLYTYGSYQAVVMPPLDTAVSINTTQLSFWTIATTVSASPKFSVGVMTDPNDFSSFVAVDTVTFTGTNWREVTVPFSAYTGNGRFVAIMVERDTGYWGAAIDDLSLDLITTCHVPTTVYSTNTTSTRITLDWVDIDPTTEWQIEYGPQGYIRGSEEGTLITTYSHPVVIDSLEPLTAYDFYIRPICSADDTARWEFPVTLTTGLCDDNDIFAIGSATSNGNTYLAPVNNFYKYTLSEIIIESTEFGGERDIEYLGFFYDHYVPMTDKTNCTIYFQPTSLSSFSNSNNVVRVDSTAVLVYSGPLNCSQGWNYFALDTTYHYDGLRNLLVIVDDNSGDYNNSSYVFKIDSCTDNKTLYYYSDSYNADVTSITSSYNGTKGVATWRPVMQFVTCLPPSCHEPEITGDTQTYHSATVTWMGDGTDYEVNIKESAAADWPATDVSVTGNSHTFSGLLPLTNYMFRVRQNCTADSLDYSDWVVGTFITDSMPCFPPDSIYTTMVASSYATLDWTVTGYENAWDIHVWYGSFDSIYRVTTHPATVDGFSAGLTYNVAIHPLCSTDQPEGGWSDTVQFTTATCPDVTGLTTSNVTTNSVTLNWNNNPMAQGWTVEYGYTGFTQGQGTSVECSTNSYVVTGLTDESTYDFYVKAVCGDNWTSENWASATATTQSGGVPCDAPMGVSTTVAENSVTVNWTAGTGNISFEIEYGPHGFTHNNGTIASATSSPAVINNLDYETQYDLYVRAVCDQNTYSPWSSMTTFTTGERPNEDCDPVQNLIVSDITSTSAHVTWEPGATGDSWQVVLTDHTGATVSDNVTSETHTELSNLTICENYTVKVRTVCDNETYSAYVTANFRTEGCEGIVDVDGISCRIFPNPATSSTTISVSGVNGKVRIAVVDMNGRTVATETLECSADCEKTMDVDKLAQGAYFVRITADNANMVRKLIVR